MIIELKKLDEIDPTQLAYHANDPLVNKYLRNSFPYPYTLDNALSFISYAIEHNTVDFGITVDGVCVGGIGLTFSKSSEEKNCEIGYWLSSKYWNRGIMTHVIQIMCRYTFENFSVNKIYADVYAVNSPSSHVLLKNRFIQEGYLKDHVYKDNAYHDIVVYSLRRGDYDNQKI